MSASLASLRIKNLALVEDLEWLPGRGFNVVTGETGAGKSVLIGALTLLLGERADKTLIRTGAESCSIEALFETENPSIFDELLAEAGVEPCEEGRLILKRQITATSGRQFVNGSPCNLSLLKKLGDLLVDLHGPHDHQSLFSREEQTRLLDDYAGLEKTRADFQRIRRSWLGLVAERDAAVRDAQSIAREIDLLRHQISEIDAAELREGEEEEIERRHRAASNARRIRETGSAAAALLAGDEHSLSSLCGELGRLLREITRLDPSAARLEERQCEIHEMLMDLSHDLDAHLQEINDDPQRLEELSRRLDLLLSLKRKYGPTLADVRAYADSARARLAELLAREERGAGLGDDIARAEKEMLRLAKELSEGRAKGAAKLQKAVSNQLLELGFRQAGFEIRLERVDPPGIQGAELAEFVFAPNPGEAPRPLRQIASSGEISRIMLAIKCALAAQDRVALLVFDEIDANVGGETATRVGEKMRELGKNHQVLCITHLPQVAAAATTHFLVEKHVENGRTISTLQQLDESARIGELARMLGDRGVSAYELARRLLARKREEKA
jgi:DNA repair protein RecN (Recombination protein N)